MPVFETRFGVCVVFFDARVVKPPVLAFGLKRRCVAKRNGLGRARIRTECAIFTKLHDAKRFGRIIVNEIKIGVDFGQANARAVFKVDQQSHARCLPQSSLNAIGDT